MVELYYNSGQFTYTLPVMETMFPDAFTMYLELSEFCREDGYLFSSPSRVYRYQALLDFALKTASGIKPEAERAEWEEILRQLRIVDAAGQLCHFPPDSVSGIISP